MATDLYTLRDLARELQLPESTVRYYRDQFATYLPAVGMGRRRRYPPEALGLLRFVADGYAHSRRREDIEAALAEVSPGAFESARVTPSAATVPLPAPPVTRRFGAPTNEELLATILDGERDRREVMWQMAREIVRLGEAIERQHLFLGGIARKLDVESGRLLPAGDAIDGAAPHADDARDDAMAQELAALREELTRERELVDRLRRAKLDIERRATEAEAQLNKDGVAPRERGSMWGRILSRDNGASSDPIP